MQSAAFSARRALLRPLHRQCYRQYSSVPPKEPFQGYGGRKRAVVITIAFLTGASSYFIFVPDPSRHAPTFDAAPLSPRYFSPSTVVSNEPSGPDTKLLKLAIQPEVLKATDQKGDSFSAIWSVFIKDDDIQVERPYTPLYGIDEEGQLSFWIKKYPNGEVGRWLHSKKSGEKIEFRGPLSTWNWKSDTWDEVVMISGGTGFAPFHQLFHSVISNPSISPSTRFTLLHSSKLPEELPPPSLLKPITDFAAQHPERLKVDLFVDHATNSAESETSLHVKRIDKAAIESSLGLQKPTTSWWKPWSSSQAAAPVPKRRMFLVCGPDPMIAAIAGPLGRNLSQGQVSGALGEMGLKSSEVYKLA